MQRNWIHNRNFENYSMGKSQTCLWLPGWALGTAAAGDVRTPGLPDTDPSQRSETTGTVYQNLLILQN